jgi:hypothetical protein
VGTRPIRVFQSPSAPVVPSPSPILPDMTGSPDRASHREHAADEDADAHRGRVAVILRELTELRIWDYEWIEAPRPGEPGPYVLALAGSTDLGYHHLVRVVFRGVRHSTCPMSFHHPAFELAGSAEQARLREIATFGPRSLAVRITAESGSPLEETAFVVADEVEVIRQPEGGPIREPYQPAKCENMQWWWNG